jgi:lipopolysaccharide biosynthesis glycosyltransferase
MDPAGAEQDFAFAGACDRREVLGIPVNRPYVNSGVLLLNLARWRRDHLSESRPMPTCSHLTIRTQNNAVLHDSILPRTTGGMCRQ